MNQEQRQNNLPIIFYVMVGIAVVGLILVFFLNKNYEKKVDDTIDKTTIAQQESKLTADKETKNQIITAKKSSPVTISGVSAVPSSSGVQIQYSTNEPAYTNILYGETENLGQEYSAEILSTSGSIGIPGLKPNTLYYFRIISKDSEENLAFYPGLSNLSTFMTKQESSISISDSSSSQKADCSFNQDGICPILCWSSSDYDCCIKDGKWTEQGCSFKELTKNPSDYQCSLEEDGFCPRSCAPGSDRDCCVHDGKIWKDGQGCYSA